MTKGTSLSFSALRTLGDGAFRVVWFGNVVGSNSVDRAIVVFSPSTVDKDTGEEIFNLSVRFPVSIPVAFLREFRIGDIWINGMWTGRRDNQARESFDLDISDGSVTILPIGVPINSGLHAQRYVLPFTHFVGHQDHTQAQCARITLSDGSTLVIPCMELVRFYFGASGSFLKRLFSGAFALDRLYSSARLNPTTLVGSIALSPDLAGVAAATVARIAFDNQAKSAARWIINSNVATSVSRVNYYPKTTFPFFGKTKLTALGRWIGNGEERVFLAEQLLRCTHPFPFGTLFYSTTRSLTKRGGNNAVTAAGAGDSDNTRSNAPESVIQLTDCSVSSSLQGARVWVEEDSEQYFPDLANKKIRRVGEQRRFATAPPDEGATEVLGGGNATSTSDIRGAEVTSDPDELFLDGPLPPEAAEVFERAVKLNQAARADYMMWKPLRDHDTDAPQKAFFRGDAIVKSDVEAPLNDIWAGLLQITISESTTTVLVLVRDNTIEDVQDHITLVRLETHDFHDEMERFCVLFAKRGRSPDFDRLTVRMFHTQLSTSLTSVLRNLSTLSMSSFF